ncbi:fimbrial protein [Pseudomonas sp. HLT2-19-2]
MGTYMHYGKWMVLLTAMITHATLAEPAKTPNLYLHGALVNEPCTLRPGDEAVELQFGVVADKYLYKNQRTLGQLFELHLQSCDISQDSTVKVQFSGVESAELPGFLALSGDTRGFAIGLERPGGQAIALNKPSQLWNLKEGETVISLKAFLQIEPEALAAQSIARGEFTATMMFTLEYE